jgi:hypothetical protein
MRKASICTAAAIVAAAVATPAAAASSPPGAEHASCQGVLVSNEAPVFGQTVQTFPKPPGAIVTTVAHQHEGSLADCVAIIPT